MSMCDVFFLAQNIIIVCVLSLVYANVILSQLIITLACIVGTKRDSSSTIWRSKHWVA